MKYTYDFLKNESINRTQVNKTIYRTQGKYRINYRKNSFLTKVSPKVLRLARTLANSIGLQNIRSTIIQKKYIISKDGKKN